MSQATADRFAMRLTTGVGELLVAATASHLVKIRWLNARDDAGGTDLPSDPPTRLLAEAAQQLRAYSEGKLHGFDLPLQGEGSPFQQSVWRAMLAIPYGETRTYGDLAAALASSARAVGRACGSNPIPIVVPCHRVMGYGGRLTGFSGGEGVATKRLLLRLEQRYAPLARSDLPLFASAPEPTA